MQALEGCNFEPINGREGREGGLVVRGGNSILDATNLAYLDAPYTRNFHPIIWVLLVSTPEIMLLVPD